MLPHEPHGFDAGAEVVAFARPHELDILTDAPGGAGVAAQVSRVLVFGVTARVDLEGVNGAAGQHFEVELTRERAAALDLAEGQTVRLVPSRLRVFQRNAASGVAQ